MAATACGADANGLDVGLRRQGTHPVAVESVVNPDRYRKVRREIFIGFAFVCPCAHVAAVGEGTSLEILPLLYDCRTA